MAIIVSLTSGDSAAASPPRVAVLLESTAAGLSVVKIRAAIAAELGYPLADSAAQADGVLVIGVTEGGEIVVTFRQAQQPVVRTMPAPHDPADTPTLVGLLAGNLVRNEALELLPPQQAPPPPAAAAPARSAIPATIQAAAAGSVAPSGAPGRRLLLMLAMGSGFGWAGGTPEVNGTAWNDQVNEAQTVEFSGLTRAGGFHLAPEVGYLWRPTLMVGAQLRLQRVLGATDTRHPLCSPDGVCHPPGGALALLARAGWLPALGERTRLMVTGSVGVGRVRHLAPLKDIPFVARSCGDDGTQPCVDTVASDLALVGPGLAVLYDLTPRFSAYLSLQGLVSVPRPMLNLDGAAGIALRL